MPIWAPNENESCHTVSMTIPPSYGVICGFKKLDSHTQLNIKRK